MQAVIIPSGTFDGAIMIRAVLSEKSSSPPPIRAQEGSRTRLSIPTSFLLIWGPMSPIKPITPEKATRVLTPRTENISMIFFIRSTGIPRCTASRSPRYSPLSCRDSERITPRLIISRGADIMI